MILIKEQWYNIRDLDDAIKLIRDEFNYDLADKMEELVEVSNRDYEDRLEWKDNDIDNFNEEINNLMNDIQDLQNEIDELREGGVEDNDNSDRIR